MFTINECTNIQNKNSICISYIIQVQNNTQFHHFTKEGKCVIVKLCCKPKCSDSAVKYGLAVTHFGPEHKSPPYAYQCSGLDQQILTS